MGNPRQRCAGAGTAGVAMPPASARVSPDPPLVIVGRRWTPLVRVSLSSRFQFYCQAVPRVGESACWAAFGLESCACKSLGGYWWFSA